MVVVQEDIELAFSHVQIQIYIFIDSNYSFKTTED